MSHGGARNGFEYMCYMQNSLLIQKYSSCQNTLVIAPQFYVCQTDTDDYCDDAATTGLDDDLSLQLDGSELYWKWNSGWMKGDSSTSDLDERISSFTVYDELLEHITDTSLWPNLKTVKMAGYSGGAQFVQRYMLGGAGHDALTKAG